VAHDTVLTGN